MFCTRFWGDKIEKNYKKMLFYSVNSLKMRILAQDFQSIYSTHIFGEQKYRKNFK
jgi:hypothetical protein